MQFKHWRLNMTNLGNSDPENKQIEIAAAALAAMQQYQPPPGTPEDFLTAELVMKARGCKSKSTIWGEIKDGSFPPPDVVLKRVRYWKSSTIRARQDAVLSANAACSTVPQAKSTPFCGVHENAPPTCQSNGANWRLRS
jgi:predicted DNA-binding transcriptional regulator AlpA